MTINKSELLKMAENPRFISGIYNYCDRWCERCAFTKRCMVFEMEETTFSDEESHDINNKKFWDGIEKSFQVAFELLHNMAQEQGITIDNINYEEYREQEEEKRKEAEETVVATLAREYSSMVEEWFEGRQSDFEEKQKALEKQLSLGIEKTEATAMRIADAVAVIRWYQHQIYVKIMRALHSEEFDERMEEDEDMKSAEDGPKDSDGSAKIALIGIDRSFGAWGELQKHFADHSDSIMNILIYLSRLRKNIEEAFPHARLFVRPGFDQELSANL